MGILDILGALGCIECSNHCKLARSDSIHTRMSEASDLQSMSGFESQSWGMILRLCGVALKDVYIEITTRTVIVQSL